MDAAAATTKSEKSIHSILVIYPPECLFLENKLSQQIRPNHVHVFLLEKKMDFSESYLSAKLKELNTLIKYIF